MSFHGFCDNCLWRTFWYFPPPWISSTTSMLTRVHAFSRCILILMHSHSACLQLISRGRKGIGLGTDRRLSRRIPMVRPLAVIRFSIPNVLQMRSISSLDLMTDPPGLIPGGHGVAHVGVVHAGVVHAGAHAVGHNLGAAGSIGAAHGAHGHVMHNVGPNGEKIQPVRNPASGTHLFLPSCAHQISPSGCPLILLTHPSCILKDASRSGYSTFVRDHVPYAWGSDRTVLVEEPAQEELRPGKGGGIHWCSFILIGLINSHQLY